MSSSLNLLDNFIAISIFSHIIDSDILSFANDVITCDNDYRNIVDVDIEKEMKKSYLEYAMSVIVSRASFCILTSV